MILGKGLCRVCEVSVESFIFPAHSVVATRRSTRAPISSPTESGLVPLGDRDSRRTAVVRFRGVPRHVLVHKTSLSGQTTQPCQERPVATGDSKFRLDLNF